MGGQASGRCAVLLMGPTGAGKSELAVQLCEQRPLEVISVDSVMVYRGMDIGTAKPDAAARGRVAHHLIDIRDPRDAYSAGDFLRDAHSAMQDIWRRGRTPLLVGGTMLYFHALSGMSALPAADVALRAAIDARAAAVGWGSLHAELAQVDPDAAARIHANDPQRIQRALEVFQLTGKAISSLQAQRVSVFADVRVIEFAIAPLERSDLHIRLRARFAAMMSAGLLEEVAQLYARTDLSAEHPSMRAVGYRQLWRYLSGMTSLELATEQAIAATRQLAKRQFTWLRRRQAAQWLPAVPRDAARTILDALSKCGCA